MNCKKYLIYPSNKSDWFARFETRDAGPYLTRYFALCMSIAEAGQLCATGRPVCIIGQDARGEVCASRCIFDRLKGIYLRDFSDEIDADARPNWNEPPAIGAFFSHLSPIAAADYEARLKLRMSSPA